MALNGLVVVFVVASDRWKKRLQEQPVQLEDVTATPPAPETMVDDGGGGP
jgi:hypothetical protein